MSEWQTMATAPKDGSKFLAYTGTKDPVKLVKWVPPSGIFGNYGGKFFCQNGRPQNPTHWMPLPAVPVKVALAEVAK